MKMKIDGHGIVIHFDREKSEWITEKFDDYDKSLDRYWDLRSKLLFKFVGRPQKELDGVKLPEWRWFQDGKTLTDV